MHPEGKQQMWNDVVGPVGQPMMSLDLQTNSWGNRE